MSPVIHTNIYLDNNATTKLSIPVKRRIRRILRSPIGNPSSPHSYSLSSKTLLNESRESIAKFCGTAKGNVIFTSCATESNSMIIQSLLHKTGKKILITSVSEHASVSNNSELIRNEDIEVVTIGVDKSGILDIEKYKTALQSEGIKLVSLAWVNSETGVKQDILALSQLARENNALFHTDASQAIGRFKIDIEKTCIDLLSFTGHKLHAPKGIGILISKSTQFLHPLLIGGEQEHGLRAGTENLIHIAALAAAIEYRKKFFNSITEQLEKKRNIFEDSIKKLIPNVRINGEGTNRVPNTSNILFRGLPAQSLLARLDSRGVYCSQTSACTSMIPEPSKILREMGLSVEDAFSSYRFSFAEDNSMSDVKKAVKIIANEVKHLRDNPLWSEI